MYKKSIALSKNKIWERNNFLAETTSIDLDTKILLDYLIIVM